MTGSVDVNLLCAPGRGGETGRPSRAWRVAPHRGPMSDRGETIYAVCNLVSVFAGLGLKRDGGAAPGRGEVRGANWVSTNSGDN